MDAIIVCPKCSSDLISINEFVACKNCGTKWPLNESVPNFVNNSYYWGEIPVEEMSSIIEAARTRGWKESVKELVNNNYPVLYKYIINENRADFIYVTELDEESVVLDLGSGWGAISCQLAKHFNKIFSIESVTERIEFQKIRASQENLNNIIPIQASFLELPLKENSFDLIVMNGVLEWIGIANENDRPDQLQVQVLRKIYSLLKPNGVLYIGIENRYWYGYFLGRPDHTGLPFTSLLPRKFSDFLVKIHKDNDYRTKLPRNSYRTYTYSYWGYRRLLRKAGFDNIDIYLVFPDYNRPNFLIPSLSNEAFLHLLTKIFSGNTRKKKLLRFIAKFITPLKLHLVFSPCFSIFGKKGN